MDKKSAFWCTTKKVKIHKQKKRSKIFLKELPFYSRYIDNCETASCKHLLSIFFEHYNFAELSGCKRAKNLKQF